MKKLIIIALVVSVLTGFAVYHYAVNLKNSGAVKTTSVVVAVKKILKNTMIQPEMITIKQLPAESAHALSTGNIDEIKGRIALVDIEENEQILKNRLSDKSQKDTSMSLTIAENCRALTIRTDEITGVAGNIKKGDRIDIIADLANATSNKLQSQMVAENIEILDVGIKATKDSKDGGGQYSSITISVPAQDVLRINYALSEGKYRIVLRSIIDKNIVNPPPYAP